MTITIFLVLCLTLIVSYLIGSIPTGYWFVKYFFNVDITKSGSKSIGATNVARILKDKKYFFIIFFIDTSKAILSLLISTYLLSYYFPVPVLNNLLILNAFILLIGNSYSIFINFKGGKGVATTLGIIAFLFSFKILSIFIIIWGITLFYKKEVFIASLTAMYFVTIIYYLFFYQSYSTFLILIFLASWLTFRHINNIKKYIKKKK